MMLNKTFYLLLLSLIPLLGFSQANSQYPDSGNKIRLGFQTTGDGLIWRDTQPKSGGYQPINNKAAWIILDTINNKFYHYKNSTWILAGGQDIDTANLIATKYNLGFKLSLADTQNMLTPYWRSGRFSGVLPVANGGTNTSTLTANKVMVGNATSGVLTPTDLHWDNSNALLGIGETSLSIFKLTVKGDFPILFNTTSTANTLTYGGTRFFRNTSTLNNGNGFQYSFNDANGNAAEYGYFGGYIIDNTVGSPDGGFIFAPTLNNSRTEAMRILNDGKVGIGVPNPTEKLHVDGNGLFTGSMSLGTPLTAANGGTGITSLGTGVATFLGTPTSGNLASAVTNETGSGSLVFGTSPTIQTATITGGNGNQLFITNGGEDFTQLNFGKSSTYTSFFTIDHRSGFQGFALGNQGSQPLYRKVSFRTNGSTNDMIITNSEVWIGWTADQGAYSLQINGTPQATGALVVTSDEKFKENITPLNKGLEIVNKLKPVTFNFVSDTQNNFSVNEEIGFIAQDVDRALSTETFAKSIVNSADDSEPTSTMGLATQNLIPILVKAIQEQNALIKALEQRILILENK